jgi:hypothetical protein
MDIEQVRPNKPNFGLVVGLSAAVMIVIFLIAYFTLDWDGKRLVPHHHQPHPTSQLVMPAVVQTNLA